MTTRSVDTDTISVPRAFKAPRALAADEIAAARACADALIPATADAPSATADDEFDRALGVAIDARADAFDAIVGALADLRDVAPNELLDRLRRFSEAEAGTFAALSAVLAGAWLLTPSVRERIGYRGQRRNPPSISEAVDQISDGLLDDVMERGAFYIPTPDGPSTEPTWAEQHPDLAKEL
jgi:hypothetical protein